MRFYLCGPIRIEAGDVVVHERALRGRQARALLALLVIERAHALSRDQLCDAIWPRRRPRAWAVSLSALISNLRRALAPVGLGGAIATAFGSHQLQLPDAAWVDVEAARSAVHAAEAALARADHAAAFGPAGVATQITMRPFLAGEYGGWVDDRRRELDDLHLRALECAARFFAANGEHATALDVASRLLAREPLRETGYQLQMRAHAALGNRGEALAAYARCRAVLRDELGVDPSPMTKQVYRDLLGD